MRAGAFALDVLPGVAVVVTMALLVLAAPNGGWLWWMYTATAVVAAFATLANRSLLPAVRGWSVGRAVVGIRVLRADGQSPGALTLVLRDVAHLLDTAAVFVGWLWPLWDPRRRTFADLLLDTEVRCFEPNYRPAGVPRRTADVVATAALLCIAGAGLSVIAVYLPDRASDQTRAAILAQGPKMVIEMLSYDPKSQHEEFAHAQSLTTERYRPQLVKQQDVVKDHPVVNEYWVTDSTVLSATPDRATMLLFMQGHRGGGNGERFITATVRVSFAKAKDGRWLVDDLNVVTKPKPAKGQK
jgi:Mce-associated membrane protein